MVKRICLLIAVFCPPLNSAELSARDILVKSKNAVVQIFVNGEFHGTGFIISKDGLIATANHVITTEESDYTQVSERIEVQIPNRGRSHSARLAVPITETSKIHDVAILRTEVIDLPYVELGDLSEAEQADSVTVIGFIPGAPQSLLLTGIVSAKADENIVINRQAHQRRIVIFEIPVRGGVSGSPVFSNTTGHVIGVVSTKVFGISELLLKDASILKGGDIQIVNEKGSVGIGHTISDVILDLRENLISGLGSAVDGIYVKELKSQAEQNK
jgi:V8-like Glu-specific endopeptidase